jgi:arginase
MNGVSVVGFPIYTLARYGGMGRSPEALRRSGLLSVLGRDVVDYGDVRIPRLEKDTLEGRVKNLGHFKRASELILRGAGEIESSELVICLGGECSFTVGALAGFKGVFKGKPGMLWVDSHGDFNTPETSPSGYIGGMCLAMACGRGPKLGDSIEKARPLLEEERLVHLGSRALDKPELELMRGSSMGLVAMKEVGLEGIEKVASQSARRLSDSADWIVCHLDVDVLDQKTMPAVNYPTPGGMAQEQVVVAIRALRATGKLKVLDVSAYNPDLDRAEFSAGVVVRLAREVLGN